MFNLCILLTDGKESLCILFLLIFVSLLLTIYQLVVDTVDLLK